MNKTGARKRIRSFLLSMKGPVRAMVHTMVIGSFLLSFIGIDINAASAYPAVLTRTGSAGSGPRDIFRQVTACDIKVPDSLGSVIARHQGSSGNLVVHIQDAHCDASTQTNIAELLKYLRREYGINSVNLEGGEGDYDLSMFSEIGDKEARRQVARYFMDAGLISGAEFAAINTPGQFSLWGVEDGELYTANLEAYRSSLEHREEMERYLARLEKALTALKRKKLNKDLLEFDRKISSYKNDPSGLDAYIAYISGVLKEQGIEAGKFPNIGLMGNALALKQRISFQKANAIREELIKRIRASCSFNEEKELNRMAEKAASGGMRPATFYKYLVEKARELSVGEDGFKSIYDFSEYVEVYDRIDLAGLDAELSEAEKELRNVFFESEEEEELLAAGDKIFLLRAFLGIKISTSGYEKMMRADEPLSIKKETAFIADLAEKNDISLDLDISSETIGEYLKAMNSFYTYSFQRDNKFIENIKYRPGSGAAVLVTGGFHSKNLQGLLKWKNISFVSILPEAANVNRGGNNYYKLLSGKMDEVTERISAYCSNLQIASILNAYSQEVWGASNLVRMKVTALILEKMFLEGKKVVILGDGGSLISLSRDENGRVQVSKLIELISDNEEMIVLSDLVAEVRMKTKGAEDRAIIRSLPIPDGKELQGVDRLISLLKKVALEDSPEGYKVAAATDFHGDWHRYQQAKERIRSGEYDEAVFEGDFIDRGPEGIRILNDVAAQKKKMPNLVTLMGNHELTFLGAMMGDDMAFDNWLANGGVETLSGLNYPLFGLKRILGKKFDEASNIIRKLQARPWSSYYIIRRIMKYDPRLRKAANWIKDNLDLYHISRNGMLYVHAGVPVDEKGNVSLKYRDKEGVEHFGLAALAVIEKEMKDALRDNDIHAKAYMFLSYGQFTDIANSKLYYQSPLWMRHADTYKVSDVPLWDTISRKGSEVMEGLGGLYGMVVGHNPIFNQNISIRSCGGRVFFIDRHWSEPDGVLLMNDEKGIGYYHKGDERETAVGMDPLKEDMKKVRKDVAAYTLTLYKRYYQAMSGEDELSASPLGTIYDKAWNRKNNILVEESMDLDRSYISIREPSTGEVLLDSRGVPLKEVLTGASYDAGLIAEKYDAILWMVSLLYTLDPLSAESNVLRGALNVLSRAYVKKILPTRQPLLAVSKVDANRPCIYVRSEMMKYKDIFGMTLFDQAARIFLARDPGVLGVSGVDLDEELLMISRRIFGSNYDDFEYAVTRMTRPYITSVENIYLYALVLASEGFMEKAQAVIDGREQAGEITPEIAAYMINLIAGYDKIKKRSMGVADREESIVETRLHEVRMMVDDMIDPATDPIMASFFKGKNWELNIFNTRLLNSLSDLMEGYIQELPVLLSIKLREIERIGNVIEANLKGAFQTGAVVDIPDGKEVIIVGDLHGKVDNLKNILQHKGNLGKIKRGEAVLVILGDAVHNDIIGDVEEDEAVEAAKDMEDSIETIRFLFQLKADHPDNVYYLLGNHDYFHPMIEKFGVHQGQVFEEVLGERFGEVFINAYRQFLKTSPILARTDDGLVCVHAGPLKKGAGIDDIRQADTGDPLDDIIFDLTWGRYDFDEVPRQSYSAEDVGIFLHDVGGKKLIVGHNPSIIPSGHFSAEIIKGTHYVTYAGGKDPGYISYRSGKVESINVIRERSEKFPDSVPYEEEEIEDENFSERMKNIGFDNDLTLLAVLGEGMNSTVYKVRDAEGRVFALKLAGGVFAGQEEDMIDVARENIKRHELMTSFIMKEESKRPENDFFPEIYYSGVINKEPYIAMELVAGEEMTGEVLKTLNAREVRSVILQMTRIIAYFENNGLVMWDWSLKNFLYQDGHVILPDLGSFGMDRNRMPSSKQKIIKEIGIDAREHDKNAGDTLGEILGMISTSVSRTRHKDILDPELIGIVEKVYRDEKLSQLYRFSGDVAKSARFRNEPVIVFMQETGSIDAGQDSMARDLERELKRKYQTDNLRVIFYDGTEGGLQAEFFRAKELLYQPGAKAVAFVPSHLHPGGSKGDILYVKDDRPAQQALPLVGPRVALALGLVDYAKGYASENLLNEIEKLIRLLSDDESNMNIINSSGIASFLDRLLAGLASLKAEKINLEDMRDSIELQEKMLTNL